MASVHEVRSWFGPTILLDAARVGSRAQRSRLWWANLLPRKILWRTYDFVQCDHTLTVDSILDVGRRSQLMRVDDRSSMAVVNRVRQPRMAFPTFVSFTASHAYMVVTGLYGILVCSSWWNPTQMSVSAPWNFLSAQPRLLQF